MVKSQPIAKNAKGNKKNKMTERPQDNEKGLAGVVIKRLESHGVNPNENLGQHFLIDRAAINSVAETVLPGSTVIEVGAGVGQLTEALAEKAGQVVALEIDDRYKPVLDEVSKAHTNVEVVFEDVLNFDFNSVVPRKKDDDEVVQIVANLPFHIIEPFLHNITSLQIESATLLVGERFAHAARSASEDSPGFGQLALLSQTFFNLDWLAEVDKRKFYPVPRTDAVLVRLTPREEHEFRADRRLFLLRRLFRTAHRSSLVKNALKEGLIEYSEVTRMGTLSKKEHNRRERRNLKADLNRAVVEYNDHKDSRSVSKKAGSFESLTQNQARSIIQRMQLPESVLNKPFQQLNNEEIRTLSRALRG